MDTLSPELVEAVRRHLADGLEDEYPKAAVEQMKSDGLFGLGIDKSLGGTRVSQADTWATMRDLGELWQPLGGLLGTHLRASAYVSVLGTQAQKDSWLPRMASGDLVVAHAYHEQGRPKFEDFETTLSGGVLNGHKEWATNAVHADMTIVITRTRGRTQAVVVPRGASGMTVGVEHARPGMLGVSLTAVTLEGVVVDGDTDCIGGLEADVSDFINKGETATSIGFAARAVGSARAGLATCRAKILDEGGTEAPSHRLLRFAELDAELRGLEAAYERAVRTQSPADAYAAKILTSRGVGRLLVEAVQFVGGPGYTDPGQVLARQHRDALALVIIDTPNDAVLARLATATLRT